MLEKKIRISNSPCKLIIFSFLKIVINQNAMSSTILMKAFKEEKNEWIMLK